MLLNGFSNVGVPDLVAGGDMSIGAAGRLG
jgi:hypothetical protein